MKVLDTTRYSRVSQGIFNAFQKSIVGQEGPKRSLVNIIEKHQAGLSIPGRPVGTLLFLGPTGVGKTYTVEAMCKELFGSERACIKIDCAEYQHGHEIAKLVGSPPGYLGHRETHPMLTQEALNQWYTEKLKLSVVLFDEIEKSSDTLWNLMLGIMDKATLTLGDNRRVDFSNTIVLMTSNLGSSQMAALSQGGLGFNSQAILDTVLDAQIDTIARAAAKKKFTPEFFNRIDEVSVFHTLTTDQIQLILDIELGRLQQQIITISKIPFFFHVRRSAKDSLLTDGFDKNYGARHLKRAVETKILLPLSRLLASGQIADKDAVIISDRGGAEFEFAIDEGSLACN